MRETIATYQTRDHKKQTGEDGGEAEEENVGREICFEGGR